MTQIAIIGIQGAGKTVFCTVWIKRMEERFNLELGYAKIEESTEEYVREAISRLNNGLWCQPTLIGEKNYLNFKLYIDDTQHSVKLIDAAGQDLEDLFDSKAVKIDPELQDYVQKANILLLIVNLKHFLDEPYGLQSKNAMTYSRAIKKACQTQRQMIALIWTACDAHEGLIEKYGGIKQYLLHGKTGNNSQLDFFQYTIEEAEKAHRLKSFMVAPVAGAKDILVKGDPVKRHSKTDGFDSTGLDEVRAWIADTVRAIEKREKAVFAFRCVIALLLVVTVIAFIVDQWKFRSLLADFDDSVKQENILKAEEQYQRIEQKWLGFMKTSSFAESRQKYDQWMVQRKEQKQKFEGLRVKIIASAEKAKTDSLNINVKVLDRNSLNELKKLAAIALVPSDIDYDSCEKIIVDIEREVNEQKRQKEFKALVQKCDESIQKAKIYPDEYQPEELDEFSFSMLSPITDAEKGIKSKIQKDYDFVQTERLRQDHVKEFEDLRTKIAQSIEESKDSTPYNPELLGTDSLEHIIAIANSDQEKDIVSEFERQFQLIREKFIEQTFLLAMNQVNDSIERAKEQCDESQLDDVALKDAIQNAVSPEDHLAVETIKQSFENTKQNVFVQRNANYEIFISEKTKELDNILAYFLSSDDEKIDKLTNLRDELEEEEAKIRTLEDKGHKTAADARMIADVLCNKVGNTLKSIQKDVILRKLTDEIGDVQKYFLTMEDFVKQFPEDLCTPSFEALSSHGKKAHESVESWNDFVRENKSTIDLHAYSIENAKKIVETLNN